MYQFHDIFQAFVECLTAFTSESALYIHKGGHTASHSSLLHLPEVCYITTGGKAQEAMFDHLLQYAWYGDCTGHIFYKIT